MSLNHAKTAVKTSVVSAKHDQAELLKRIALLEKENQSLKDRFEQREIRYRQQIENLELTQDQTLNELENSHQKIEEQNAQIEAYETERTHQDPKVVERLEAAYQQLDRIRESIGKAQKKVSYLHDLEEQLERTVETTHKLSMSRRGIYRDQPGNHDVIWPETERVICSEVIDRLELMDEVIKRLHHSHFFPGVAQQLEILKDSFVSLLHAHSVDQFEFDPGETLTVDARSKIILISVDELDDPKLKKSISRGKGQKDRSTVLKTVRPGYIYHNGWEDVIIRKAEVVLN